LLRRRSKEQMKSINNKTTAIAICIVLMISIASSAMLIPSTAAHSPAWQITTYAFITANPNPVGANQSVLVVMWLDKIFDPTATLTNNYRFHNYELTITAPDGTTALQKTYDVVQDTTGVQTLSFTPTQTGTYNLYFSFPGQNYTQYGAGTYNPASALIGDYFTPSNASTNLVVQSTQLPSPIGSYPLPNSYWSRPIYGEDTDWYTISSNWLGTGSPVLSSTGSGAAGSGDISGFTQSAQMQRYPGDAVGPYSAHIMWTKPLQAGGVVGGDVFPIPANTYFEGSAYNQRYTNPIIMNGILYYTEPVSFTGTTAGPTDAVNLQTGQVVWSRSDVPSLSFGYIYDVEDPNQHGVYPPILFTSNFARAFDAGTGDQLFNVTGVPSGMEALGPQGEHLRYVYTNLGTASNPNWYLAEWNSSKLWTYTGLSPAVINATNGASWSMTGGIMTNTFTVNGSVTDPTSPYYTYDWNVSLPWLDSLNGTISSSGVLSNPVSVLAVFPNNMMLVRYGIYPTLSDNSLTGIVSSQNPYTYYAINLNASKAQIGSILWQKTYNAPAGNITVTFGGADPTVGVFVEGYKETMQWVGYSLSTGEQLWGPVGNQSSWDFFGNPAYNYAAGQVAYGKLYSIAYGGILYCYDLTSGKLLWTYGNGGYPGNDTTSGFYTPYGNYPAFINAVGNGVIYMVTSEHTVETPIYKGAMARAVNATTGQELWTLSDYTGEFSTMSYAMADGYSTFFNGYDNQIYSVGKGPSSTTITAPDQAVANGVPVVLRGSVVDISAGTKQSEQAADFPHGVPVSSEASMQQWMQYVYQQGPMPTNFTGVTVVLSVVDSNNNCRQIGTTTTDENGAFSYTWTPDITGNFAVYATFEGSNGYYPSSAESSFNVMAAASATPTPAPAASSPMTDTYVLISAIAIIIAVALVGAVLALMVRKR
jgi:hypothetical protein